MAYGASLESWLGESPRGFESPILRGMRRPPLRGFFHSRILLELYSNPGFLVPRPVATHRVAPRAPILRQPKRRSFMGRCFRCSYVAQIEKCPRLSSGAFWLSNHVGPSQTQKEQASTKESESQTKTEWRSPTVPAFLIIKTLSGPRISEFHPVVHLLDIFGFLFLIHVFFTFFAMDLSEAK